MIPAKIALAQARHEAAARKLMEETRRAYPVGTLVEVMLGKARVVGVVEGHAACWWHEPDGVRIRNEATGKQRKFSATSEAHGAFIISGAKA